MTDALRRLIGETDIALFFVPQIKAESMRVTGFEVLVQLQRHLGKPVRLSRCIISGWGGALADALVEWTVETACLHMVDWVKMAGPLSLTINIPAHCFRRADLVCRVLTRSGLPAAQLEIEVPERSYRILGRASTQEFTEAGVSLCLEHHGRSDLEGLDLRPFGRIKVPWKMQLVPMGMVCSVAAEGRRTGRGVLADGVVSQSQVLSAAITGCDFMQGLYFCPPLPAKRVGTYLRWAKLGCNPIDASRRAS